MLSSLAAEHQRYLGPLAALLCNRVQNLNVLLDGPSLMVNLLVHVIIPAFPALFWGLEVVSLGREEDMSRDVGPLELPDSI